ncbi:protein of unknown function [Paraburkholderia kururiensis]
MVARRLQYIVACVGYGRIVTCRSKYLSDAVTHQAGADDRHFRFPLHDCLQYVSAATMARAAVLESILCRGGLRSKVVIGQHCIQMGHGGPMCQRDCRC